MSNIDFSKLTSGMEFRSSRQWENINVLKGLITKYYNYLGLKSKLVVELGKITRAYCFKSSVYHLEICESDYIKTDIDYRQRTHFLKVATHLAHEFAHLYFEDVVYFKPLTMRVKVDTLKTAISTLKETRADVFAGYLVSHHYGIPNFDWIDDSEVDYQKVGYFGGSMRKYIAGKFPEYNRDVVKYVLGIFERDEFVTEYGMLRNTNIIRKADGRPLHEMFKNKPYHQMWLIKLLKK